MKIDDPVGCVGVHWAAGFWGMIAVGLFAEIDSVAGLSPQYGIFRGGNGHLLASNIAGCLAITLWSGGLTAILVRIYSFSKV